MSATELRQSFRRRFRAVARQIWSLRVLRGAALTVVVAAAVFAVVAAADYLLELSVATRAAALGGAAVGVAVLFAKWVVQPARDWNRERVASELEDLFPRLGQRLRTAAELGERPADELTRDGVAPGLVAALEEETAEKVRPLPLQAALPWRPALVAAAVALVCVAAVAAGAVWLPEWRTAVNRAALVPTAYTTLTVSASADAVNENSDVDVRAELSGRARPAVVLHVREAGDTEWRQETMEAADGVYAAKLARLRATTEFFVTAGPERSPVKVVAVRHKLKLLGSRAEVTSPAYTGVPVVAVESGTFSGVVGSTARVRFELDRAPVAAELVVRRPARPKDAPTRVPLALDGRFLSADLQLDADVVYAVEARDSDGMPLVENSYRVRVVADQPPAVGFETPGESMEVHTLAEVLMRARARDDFGLTKVGIVFQVNNEEERTLILLDVDKPNQRELKAEQLLALEQYLLTQKDCVAYYAFAEDNRPDGPQRTTTELRFIDIRPFLRTYRLQDAMDPTPGMGPQRELIFLDEVIARQRFNLNQTMRLEARAKVRVDPGQVEKIAQFENKLATQTHDLADFLAGLGVDGTAILADAEEAMLKAVDSLNADKFANAINQQRDALRYLMEARDTAQQSLFRQPPKVRAQARAFDRLQRQKLRRPQNSEALSSIAGELAKLASDEEMVARDIAGAAPMGMNGMGGGTPDPKADPKTAKGGEDPAQEKQDEIAGRATAVEKAAEKAKGLTPLAKERITEAAKAANAGADALGKGDRAAARKDVDKAKELFQAAAKQVAALAADEAAQQLAAARDLANEIAAQANPTNSNAGGMGGMGEDKMPGLGGAAEAAKSVKDILENLAGSTAAGDADAARKAGGILKDENLKDAIDRLSKAGAGDAAERKDLADRFAALGQKLDQAYREAVAPRLEELSKLERMANDLQQRAGVAEDATEFRRLQNSAGDFLEKLDAAGLATLAGDDLRNALRSPNTPAARDLIGRGFAATHAKLLGKLQEFVTGDRTATGSEAVPPEYRDLVERYQRALSGGTK